MGPYPNFVSFPTVPNSIEKSVQWILETNLFTGSLLECSKIDLHYSECHFVHNLGPI